MMVSYWIATGVTTVGTVMFWFYLRKQQRRHHAARMRAIDALRQRTERMLEVARAGSNSSVACDYASHGGIDQRRI